MEDPAGPPEEILEVGVGHDDHRIAEEVDSLSRGEEEETGGGDDREVVDNRSSRDHGHNGEGGNPDRRRVEKVHDDGSHVAVDPASSFDPAGVGGDCVTEISDEEAAKARRIDRDVR